MSALEEMFLETPMAPAVERGIKVEVFAPEQPFGGVQVEGVADIPIQIEINTGSPVFSVFGRTGNVVGQASDYAAFYAPLGAAAPVSSVFGRLGAVAALEADYQAFYPKLSGAYADPAWITSLAYSKLTGVPAPPTIPVQSVFGRTGNITAQTGDYDAAKVTNAVSTLGSYANPSWITSLAWAKITGAPAFEVPLSFVESVSRTTNTVRLVNDVPDPTTGPDAGTSRFYGINTSNVRGFYQFPNYVVDPMTTKGDLIVRGVSSVPARLGVGANGTVLTADSGQPLGMSFQALPAAPVSSVFTRTGAIVAQANDYTFAQIGSKPTTLSGYGITDAQPLDSDLTAIAGLTTTSFGRGFLTQADAAASRTYIGAQAAGSYEPALGNPSANGYILSSTSAGVRSWIAPPSGGGIGGSTGGTDNAILRADGTGGATLQATGVTIDDTNNFSGFQRLYGTGSGNYIGWGDMMFGDVTGLGKTAIGFNAAQSVVFRDNGGAINFVFDNTSGLQLSKNLVVNSPSTITGKGSVPTGGTAGQILSKVDGTDYNLAWVAAGGTGTVTSFSSGDLSPLFTTSEATPTTTPALSFALSSAGANTFFGNNTGLSAAPSYTAMAALTKTDDTNVTLALGGTPATALFKAVSLTLGWTGVLAQSRGGTGVSAFGNLTSVNDTNVTITLGGTPAASVRTAVSLTLGWTGTLATSRGGTGNTLGAEPPLGNPSANGQLLSSTTGGTRSWVAAPPTFLINSSTANQTGFSTDAYLTGSNVAGVAGSWVASGIYYVKFDLSKTAAGTGQIVVTVRFGTAGTTSDTALCTLTFPAGTATADNGTVEVWVNFRTVTTAITCSAVGRIVSGGGGLTGGTTSWNAIAKTTGSGGTPASATSLGISVNGGSGFQGTVTTVQAEYKQ